MSTWYGIRLYENQIKARTDRSVLVQMPHSSDYDGWMFWHPAKLIQEYKNSPELRFSDEFVFHLKKYGSGQNKFKIIGELDIDAETLAEAFQNNIDNFTREELPLYYTPEKLEPEGSVADESLIDD